MPATSVHHARPGRILPERTVSSARLVPRALSSRYPEKRAAPSARQGTFVRRAPRTRRHAMRARMPTSPASRLAEIALPVATAARARCAAGAAARAIIAHPLPAASCCVLQVGLVAWGGWRMPAVQARAQKATTARPEASAPRRHPAPRARTAARLGSARSQTAWPVQQETRACWVRQCPPPAQLALSPKMRAWQNATVASRASTRTTKAALRARCAQRAATALEVQRSQSRASPALSATRRG